MQASQNASIILNSYTDFCHVCLDLLQVFESLTLLFDENHIKMEFLKFSKLKPSFEIPNEILKEFHSYAFCGRLSSLSSDRVLVNRYFITPRILGKSQ